MSGPANYASKYITRPPRKRKMSTAEITMRSLLTLAILAAVVAVVWVLTASADPGPGGSTGSTGSAQAAAIQPTATVPEPEIKTRWTREESALLASLAAESTVAPSLGDDSRVGLAEVTCAGLGAGLSTDDVTDSLRGPGVGVAKPERFVHLATNSLCPEFADEAA